MVVHRQKDYLADSTYKLLQSSAGRIKVYLIVPISHQLHQATVLVSSPLELPTYNHSSLSSAVG
jgi:hypothetical protein